MENPPRLLLLTDKKAFSQHTVQEALKTRIGTWKEASRAEDQRTYPAAMMRNLYAAALADLILYDGVMEMLGIHKVTMTSAKPDLTIGCLLYPKFWKQ